MKTLLVLVLTFTFALCSSQVAKRDSIYKDWLAWEQQVNQMELNSYKNQRVTDKINLVTTGAFLLNIVTDAWGDAQMDKGNKELGHLGNAISTGALLGWGVYMLDQGRKGHIGTRSILKLSLAYPFMRAGLFRPVYNNTRNLDYGYFGSTSYYDRTFGKLKAEDPIWVMDGVLFIAGFHMSLTF